MQRRPRIGRPNQAPLVPGSKYQKTPFTLAPSNISQYTREHSPSVSESESTQELPPSSLSSTLSFPPTKYPGPRGIGGNDFSPCTTPVPEVPQICRMISSACGPNGSKPGRFSSGGILEKQRMVEASVRFHHQSGVHIHAHITAEPREIFLTNCKITNPRAINLISSGAAVVNLCQPVGLATDS